MTDYRQGRWRPRSDVPGLYYCTWVDHPDAVPCNDAMGYPIGPAFEDDEEWDGDALCLDHLVGIDLDVGPADRKADTT